MRLTLREIEKPYTNSRGTTKVAAESAAKTTILVYLFIQLTLRRFPLKTVQNPNIPLTKKIMRSPMKMVATKPTAMKTTNGREKVTKTFSGRLRSSSGDRSSS